MKLTEDDQRGTESSGGSAATRSLQSQEDGRNEENTADGREGSHGDIGDTWLQVILADLLKVEAHLWRHHRLSIAPTCCISKVELRDYYDQRIA